MQSVREGKKQGRDSDVRQRLYTTMLEGSSNLLLDRLFSLDRGIGAGVAQAGAGGGGGGGGPPPARAARRLARRGRQQGGHQHPPVFAPLSDPPKKL
jgi:hypothetical protein